MTSVTLFLVLSVQSNTIILDVDALAALTAGLKWGNITHNLLSDFDRAAAAV